VPKVVQKNPVSQVPQDAPHLLGTGPQTRLPQSGVQFSLPLPQAEIKDNMEISIDKGISFLTILKTSMTHRMSLCFRLSSINDPEHTNM
jgi:hypothetical protein